MNMRDARDVIKLDITNIGDKIMKRKGTGKGVDGADIVFNAGHTCE